MANDNNLYTVRDIINKYGNDLRNQNLRSKKFENCDFSNILVPSNTMLFQESLYRSIDGSIFNNFDFSKFDMSGVSMKRCVIGAGCIFPKDKDFFKKLSNSSIEGASFKHIDLSIYDFSGVNIAGVTFGVGCTLPNDINLFQYIKGKNLLNVTLPEGDYSIYNFNGVTLIGVKFSKHSKLPKDSNLFQAIRDKSINFSVLPEGDYRLYNFKGVSLLYTEFGEKSLMPNQYNFVKNTETILGAYLGDDFYSKAHLYNLKDLSYSIKLSNLTLEQSAVIFGKYENEINKKRIILTL